jgi:hypothetical protein
VVKNIIDAQSSTSEADKKNLFNFSKVKIVVSWEFIQQI